MRRLRSHRLRGWVTERTRFLAHLVYRAVPKVDDVVLYGWPDFEDSVRSLEPLLSRCAVRRVVLLVDDRHGPRPPLGPSTVVLNKRSIQGFVAFIRARYVLFTHQCYMRRFPSNVVSVNLWHGMPVKMLGPGQVGWKPISARFTLASSTFWTDRVAAALEPTERVLVTGLPRTDRMHCDAARVRQQLAPECDGDGPLLIWLPTYRTPVRIVTGTDGAPAGNVFEMPDIDLQRLNELLARWSATLVVKPHPMAHSPGVQSSDRVKVIDDTWLSQHSVSLYEVLGASDVLISDVSSVTVDFLLLDRPIIHAMPDHEAYGAGRGFALTPLCDYLMGPLIVDFEELLGAIEAELNGSDPGREQRRRMVELMQAGATGSAAQRVLDAIGLTPRV